MNTRTLISATALGASLVLSACGGGSGGGNGAVTPPPDVPVVPFAPSASDVADPDNHYGYPNASAPVTDPSVLDVRITYAPTTVTAPKAGAGYYVYDAGSGDYVCQEFDASLSYPITLTLADVNRDIDENDICVPEINVNFQAPGHYPVTTAYNAKMRMRGSSTRYASQKSYRVKLRSTAPCSTSTVPCWRNDEITLQFNKHPYDLSRVRNKLAFDLMRDIPYLNSLRTQFAHITYNDGSADSDMGLFTHVEKMGPEYLANRGYPADSNIYKANEFYFAEDDRLSIDPSVDGSRFEEVLEVENDAGDHTALRAMISAVNNEDIAFATTFDKHFNRNNYLAWLATNILMGNHDTITQNFALYQPADDERFYFLPWDYDGSLGFEDQPDVKAAGTFYDDWQLGLSNWWGSPLHRRFIQQPGHVALIKAAVSEIKDTYLLNASIQARLDSYRGLVSSLVTAVPDVLHLPTEPGSSASPAAQWETEYERIAGAVNTNYGRFLTLLESPMPFWQAARVSGGSLILNWDAATDLQGNTVTYKVEVSSDPAFGSLLSPVRYVTTTSTSFSPAPAAGTYYMRVTADDGAGHRTRAFDRTDIGDNRYFGVLRFTLP